MARVEKRKQNPWRNLKRWPDVQGTQVTAWVYTWVYRDLGACGCGRLRRYSQATSAQTWRRHVVKPRRGWGFTGLRDSGGEAHRKLGEEGREGKTGGDWERGLKWQVGDLEVGGWSKGGEDVFGQTLMQPCWYEPETTTHPHHPFAILVPLTRLWVLWYAGLLGYRLDR